MDAVLKIASALRGSLSGDSRSRLVFLEHEPEESDLEGSPSDGDISPGAQRAMAAKAELFQKVRNSCGGAKAIHKALVTPPTLLCFAVPDGVEPGARVNVDGPHGKLQVHVPENVAPGDQVALWLGPQQAHKITVPEGSKPGDLLSFNLATGEEIQVQVPEDKRPGDVFDCIPPVLMVRTPEGAKPGDMVVFTTPDGDEKTAEVPEQAEPLSYFPVLSLRKDDTVLLRTNAMLPKQISVQIPEDARVGSSMVVDGPHGKLTMPVPADAVPGQEVSIWLGPSRAYQFIVPEDKKAGDILLFQFMGDKEIQVEVPSDKQPGDSFYFIPPVLMVQAPSDAKGGGVVIFKRPDGREQTACIPHGVQPHQYFEVPYTNM